MTTLISQVPPVRAGARSRAGVLATAALAGPLFLAVAALVSISQQDALHSWGWTALDHHGVPWPSALELTALGWLQSAAFAFTGATLLALARRVRPGLPRRRFATVATAGLAVAGAGMVAAAFPLDNSGGDPAQLASWVGSWHAVVHVAGFAAAALGGLVAVVATAFAARGALPRLARISSVVAVVALLSLALPGAVGWYVFLAAFFSWTAVLAVRVSER